MFANMFPALQVYFQQRLERALRNSRTNYLALFEPASATHTPQSWKLRVCQAGKVPSSPHSAQGLIDISFAEQSLGVLQVHTEPEDFFGTETRGLTTLDALVAQLAAVWKEADFESAIELDRHMERLERENALFDWCGVYVLREGRLYLAAFRGAPSPHTIIPQYEGICGAAVRENRTLNIGDVNEDPRYLSCDVRTKSEIVIPIQNAAGQPIGEIDIDSHTPHAFKPEQAHRLEELARELAPVVLKLV